MPDAARSALLVPGLTLAVLLATPVAVHARNIVLFVADGLRPSAVNASDAPTLAALRDRGVYFSNSHSVFPTVTMANAAAIATGHQPGDTGIYSNSPWIGHSSFNAGNFGRTVGSPTPFIENDQILADVADHLGGNPLGENTLLAAARAAGFGTAAIGKLGPAALQDPTQQAPEDGRFRTPQTVLIDDATGADGVPLSPDVSAALRAAGLPLTSTARVQPPGDLNMPGTLQANGGQQAYFVDAATRAVLPLLKRQRKPFLLIYWSRDPDGTQHNQGDSLNRLWPGINGETSRLGVRNADDNLRRLLDWLNSEPAIAADTDVIVTSDHGFATLSKRAVDADYVSTNSLSARTAYEDVPAGFLPPGFLALDLARHLDKALYDPDRVVRDGWGNPVYSHLNIATQHPSQGSGLIGGDGRADGPTNAQLIVTANGGSDSIYLPTEDPALVGEVIHFLTACDYVGGVFVADQYGRLPGTLPLSAINLAGSGKLPVPAIVVAFKSFALSAADAAGTADPLPRTVQISDTPLQQGQGQHGGLGRESTLNFMLAVGPDFRANYADPLPASNADLAPTIAELLDLRLLPHGELMGRGLHEALRVTPAPSPAAPERCTAWSPPAPDGRRTILQYQMYAGRRYVDSASFRRAVPGEREGCTAEALPGGRR